MAIAIKSSADQPISINERLAAKEAAIKKNQDMYFKLLVAQLQNQDIDNNVDMNQMTQNLFSMNQVQSLMSIEKQLDEIKEFYSDRRELQADFLGKSAVIESNKVYLDDSISSIHLGYKVNSQSEARLEYKIKNDRNEVLYQDSLPNSLGGKLEELEIAVKDPEGRSLVPRGKYKIEILAHDLEGRNLPVTTYVSSKINQVNRDGSLITDSDEVLNYYNILALQDETSPIRLNSASGKIQAISDLKRLKEEERV